MRDMLGRAAANLAVSVLSLELTAKLKLKLLDVRQHLCAHLLEERGIAGVPRGIPLLNLTQSLFDVSRDIGAVLETLAKLPKVPDALAIRLLDSSSVDRALLRNATL